MAGAIAIPEPAIVRPREDNRIRPEDHPVHEWYRFVLSYPPHLVRTYLERFDLGAGDLVMDPFCGTGTTLVECKKSGVSSIGTEANPVAWFASDTKTRWDVDPERLSADADAVAEEAQTLIDESGATDANEGPMFASHAARKLELLALPDEQAALLLTASISPLPLHKALVLRDAVSRLAHPSTVAHLRLAFATALVNDISNLHFGPEVGVGPPKTDAPVVAAWRGRVRRMAADLRAVRDLPQPDSRVLLADSRELPADAGIHGVSAVITSPPYPNEKDYSRTTRLESVLLGFTSSRAELRAMKKGLLRSNTRGVYVSDTDDRLVADNAAVQRIANEIEERRLALGKTSGFERMYPRVTKLYFGGMARHFMELTKHLRPGARLAYVVGDQASYLQVHIPTGEVLAGIAESLGYRVEGLDLFRTRLATATKKMLREEVLVLQWPGA
jgi:hypothetical protein